VARATKEPKDVWTEDYFPERVDDAWDDVMYPLSVKAFLDQLPGVDAVVPTLRRIVEKFLKKHPKYAGDRDDWVLLLRNHIHESGGPPVEYDGVWRGAEEPKRYEVPDEPHPVWTDALNEFFRMARRSRVVTKTKEDFYPGQFRLPRIVRVSVLTNFGHTPEEVELLTHIIGTDGVDKWINLPFVNTNAIDSIDSPFPCFVTLNPDWDEFIEPHGKHVEMIRAGRIKWIAGGTRKYQEAVRLAIAWCLENEVPILWTRARFFAKEDLLEVCEQPELYTTAEDPISGHKATYYWTAVRPPYDNRHAFMCDEQGYGCPACRLCTLLSYGIAMIPFALDLSASLATIETEKRGQVIRHCPHGCRFCFAGRVYRARRGLIDPRGEFGSIPKCDEIKPNAKMGGREGWEHNPSSHFCYETFCELKSPSEGDVRYFRTMQPVRGRGVFGEEEEEE
jgi:hypothetical protein